MTMLPLPTDERTATAAAGTTRRKGKDSKQDWRIPLDLLAAVAEQYGDLDVDLACDASNKVAPIGLVHPDVDALTVEWAELYPNSIMWLNPPYKLIDPWAAKCAAEAAKIRELGGEGLIIMLTPASVGSVWFFDHVHGKALVRPLSPRLTFRETDGTPAEDAYPKDCMLSIFGLPPGFDPWRYAPEVVREKKIRAPKEVKRCKLAPPGWACKRRPSHDGPCHMLPITPSLPPPNVAP